MIDKFKSRLFIILPLGNPLFDHVNEVEGSIDSDTSSDESFEQRRRRRRQVAREAVEEQKRLNPLKLGKEKDVKRITEEDIVEDTSAKLIDLPIMKTHIEDSLNDSMKKTVDISFSALAIESQENEQASSTNGTSIKNGLVTISKENSDNTIIKKQIDLDPSDIIIKPFKAEQSSSNNVINKAREDSSKPTQKHTVTSNSLIIRNAFDKCFVGACWREGRKEELRESCSYFGVINDVHIIEKDGEFLVAVIFEDESSASKCFEKISGQSFYKQRLDVYYASDEVFVPKTPERMPEPKKVNLFYIKSFSFVKCLYKLLSFIG